MTYCMNAWGFPFLSMFVLLQVVFQQGTTKLSVEKDKTSVVSDLGISFTDPRTQTTFFSTDFDNHEFHLPKGVKVLSVKKASTERVCMGFIVSSSSSTSINVSVSLACSGFSKRVTSLLLDIRSPAAPRLTWTSEGTAEPSFGGTRGSTSWAGPWSSKWGEASSSEL